MKAIVVHEYGGPEVLKFEEYPDPVPGPGEVLVRVAAASVNPIDYKRRAGLTKDFYPLKFPGLIGVDIAGTVVKTGPKVEGFSVTATKCSLWRTISRLRQNQLKASLGRITCWRAPGTSRQRFYLWNPLTGCAGG